MPSPSRRPLRRRPTQLASHAHPHRSGGGHEHLWLLPDGTGLHAPPGELLVDDDTGRLACHLCGRWFVSLASHVRAHGHTAATYRATMRLLTTTPLIAASLSHRIVARQRLAYERSEDVRDALGHGHELARTGELARRAQVALAQPEGRAERRRRRGAALAAGRERATADADRRLAARIEALGATDLAGYLRAAHAGGASVDELRSALQVGRTRLRRELAAAGVTPRPTGQNSAAGKRSRADAADLAAAVRVGTDDLTGWLADRHAQGWPVTRLAAAVGHSPPWVRTRLPASGAR